MKHLWLMILTPLISVCVFSAHGLDSDYAPREDREWGYMLQFGYHATDSDFFNDAYEIDTLIGPRFSYVTVGLASSVMWWRHDESYTMQAVKPWLPDNALNPRTSQSPLPALSIGIGVLADFPLAARLSIALLSSVRFMLTPSFSVKWDEEISTPPRFGVDLVIDHDESIKPTFRTIGRIGAHFCFKERDTLASPFFGIHLQREIDGKTATFMDNDIKQFNIDSMVIYGGWLL